MRTLILALSFLSGVAGLFYESVWTRYLGLLVGHDAYAQVMVLVIFLGGMSIGAYLLSGWSARIPRPLLAYALIEGAIGVMGLFFHDVFVATAGLAYDRLFPALAGSAALGLVRWGLPALLILPQSILLGATFPLLSAAVLRRTPTRPGQVLAWVYFTNALGGAVGVLLAGFVVLRLAGLPGVVAAAGTINLVVALGALLLGRQRAGAVAPTAPAPVPMPVPPPSEALPAARLEPLLLTVAFGTAVASFAYEIDWIRMLALVLGSATHAFELMLSAFILGIAIGALSVRRIDRHRAPLALLGRVQVAMGVLAILTLPVYVASFDWFTTLMAMVTRTDAGYAGFSVLRYGLCLVIMLPATICAGMTLPLITRALFVGGMGERAIGRVYAWNTFGSIVGVSLAALVFLPLLGLKAMLLSAGALDILLGLLILWRLGARRQVIAASAVAVSVIAAVVILVPLDRALLTSGVFRTGTAAWQNRAAVRYYADGRTATVSVAEGSAGDRAISTNGKPDASLGPWWRSQCEDALPRRLGGDESTQTLLPLLTAAYHPGARTAAVIGFGSGMSSHLLLGLPWLKKVTTIEIEPRMVEGARAFLPANARVYDDPRSRIVIGDAKAHFTTSAIRWDLILSEPSNPWVSGVAGLFTVEFYARVRASLADGGVFGQWLHTYQLNDALVLSVLAAIDRVFPSWTLHQVGPGDLLVVASAAATMPPLAAATVLGSPPLQDDLCRFVPFAPSDFAALTLGTPALLRPLLARVGQPNSDYYPVLDLGAERTRFGLTSASGMLALGTSWWNLAQALAGAAPSRPAPTALPAEGLGRLDQGWIAQQLGREPEAVDAAGLQAQWSLQQWELLRDSPAPPRIWRAWLDAMAHASALVHGGAAGVADSGFFAAAEAAAHRLDAPPGVHSVIAFRHAVAAWDAPTALAAVARLDADGALSQWLPVAEAMDGAVVLALRAGDQPAADRWLTALAPRSGRAPDDLRMLLLGAWVEARR